MIKLFIICWVIILVWIVISFIIASLFSIVHGEEIFLDTWRNVFLIPILLAIVGVTLIDYNLSWLLYYAGMRRRPSDNPLEEL